MRKNCLRSPSKLAVINCKVYCCSSYIGVYSEDNLWGHFSLCTMCVPGNREGRDRSEALRPFGVAGSSAFSAPLAELIRPVQGWDHVMG